MQVLVANFADRHLKHNVLIGIRTMDNGVVAVGDDVGTHTSERATPSMWSADASLADMDNFCVGTSASSTSSSKSVRATVLPQVERADFMFDCLDERFPLEEITIRFAGQAR